MLMFDCCFALLQVRVSADLRVKVWVVLLSRPYASREKTLAALINYD